MINDPPLSLHAFKQKNNVIKTLYVRFCLDSPFSFTCVRTLWMPPLMLHYSLELVLLILKYSEIKLTLKVN